MFIVEIGKCRKVEKRKSKPTVTSLLKDNHSRIEYVFPSKDVPRYILPVFCHVFCHQMKTGGPPTLFRSVGRPKHVRVMAGALEGDIFIGPKAEVIPTPSEDASSKQRTFIVPHEGSVPTVGHNHEEKEQCPLKIFPLVLSS